MLRLDNTADDEFVLPRPRVAETHASPANSSHMLELKIVSATRALNIRHLPKALYLIERRPQIACDVWLIKLPLRRCFPHVTPMSQYEVSQLPTLNVFTRSD
jgi:hypothetical protein